MTQKMSEGRQNGSFSLIFGLLGPVREHGSGQNPHFGAIFKVALSTPNCHLRCLDPLNTFSECKKNIFGPHMTYGDA